MAKSEIPDDLLKELENALEAGVRSADAYRPGIGGPYAQFLASLGPEMKRALSEIQAHREARGQVKDRRDDISDMLKDN